MIAAGGGAPPLTGGKAGCPSTFSLPPPPRAKQRIYWQIMRPPSSRSTVVRRSCLSNNADNGSSRAMLQGSAAGYPPHMSSRYSPGRLALARGQGGLVETNGERTKV
jgi:hypothetical protein